MCGVFVLFCLVFLQGSEHLISCIYPKRQTIRSRLYLQYFPVLEEHKHGVSYLESILGFISSPLLKSLPFTLLYSFMMVNITDDSVGTHHMSGSALSSTLTQQIRTELTDCHKPSSNSPACAISLF